MRTWKDFDLIQLIMLPMFMFSATFYPISVYPEVLEWIVRCLPLYHGIELVRSLTTGTVGAVPARQRRLPARDGPRRALDLVAPDRQAAAEVGASCQRTIAAPLAPRVAGGTRPPDAADAAEVVVESHPSGARCGPRSSSSASARSSTPGSASTSSGMGWTRGRATAVSGVEPLVEDRRRAPSRARCAAVSHPPSRSRARGRRRRTRASAPSGSRGGRRAAGRRTRCRTRRGGCSAACRSREARRRRRRRGECVRTQARPCAVDGDHVRRVLAAGRRRSRRPRRARGRARSRESSARRGHPRQELGDAREPAARRDAPAVEADEHGIAPARRGSRARSSAVITTPSTSSSASASEPRVHARGALLARAPRASARGRAGRGSRLPASVRPSRAKRSAPRPSGRARRTSRATGACISGSGTPARASRSAGSTSRGHGRRPSRSQSSPSAAGKPRDGARRPGRSSTTTSSSPKAIGSSTRSPRPDGTRREAVEVQHARAVEHDRVAAGEEPAHDRLGDARGERHRHDRIRRGPAVGEDLGADLGGGGMTCCDRGLTGPSCQRPDDSPGVSVADVGSGRRTRLAVAGRARCRGAARRRATRERRSRP